MMNFRIVFSKLLDMLLPPMLRQPKMQAYLTSVCKPIADIQTEFVALIEAHKNELSYSTQTMLVEQRLNEEIGQVNIISIVNLTNDAIPPLYLGIHNSPGTLLYSGVHGNTSFRYYISRHSEYSNTDFDFEVIVVNSFSLSEANLYKIIIATTRYTPFGKKFRIKTSTGTILYPFPL